MRSFRIALLAVLLLACCTSGGPADAGDAPLKIPVTIQTDSGPITFQAELADSPEERSRGLMFREQMDELDGMIFLFPSARQNTFWMRNTLIPLDMIFIQSDLKILGIVENAEPRTDTGRSVPGESQFVLELNGGHAQKYGIRAGQTVVFMAAVPKN